MRPPEPPLCSPLEFLSGSNDWATTIPPLLRFYGSKLPPSPTESPLEDGQAQVDHRVILIYEVRSFAEHVTPAPTSESQRHTLACNAQEAVLFLHRRYFARALNDTSGKLATTFATSLNAVTRSCHVRLFSRCRVGALNMRTGARRGAQEPVQPEPVRRTEALLFLGPPRPDPPASVCLTGRQ